MHDIERSTVRRGKLDSRSLGTRPAELQPLAADQAELVICDQTIERTFGWLVRHRRLVRDYEQRLDVSQAMIHIALGSVLLRRLFV